MVGVVGASGQGAFQTPPGGGVSDMFQLEEASEQTQGRPAWEQASGHLCSDKHDA